MMSKFLTKTKFIEEANKEVERVENEHRKGVITNDERYKKVIEIWTQSNEKITESLFEIFEKDQKGLTLFTPWRLQALGVPETRYASWLVWWTNGQTFWRYYRTTDSLKL